MDWALYELWVGTAMVGVQCAQGPVEQQFGQEWQHSDQAYTAGHRRYDPR